MVMYTNLAMSNSGLRLRSCHLAPVLECSASIRSIGVAASRQLKALWRLLLWMYVVSSRNGEMLIGIEQLRLLDVPHESPRIRIF